MTHRSEVGAVPDMPELAVDVSRIEGYLVELLNKLERIASVMERFDNGMNPTLGLAEEVEERLAQQQEVEMFPAAVRLPSAARPSVPGSVQQAG